jgi:1L-myo-inositol 1-phosphate cytidylyltransferase
VIPRTALILAAGFGSRLRPDEGHKILTTIGDRRLLDFHIEHFHRLGVTEIVVVTGFDAEPLEAAIAHTSTPKDLTLRCARNPSFEGQNGPSVLAGVDAIGDQPFWLTMSDHLFDPALFDDLRHRFPEERDPRWEGALFIDRKLDAIYDMPDATKVRLDSPPFGIGKVLEPFDAVDVGLFFCNAGFVEALRAEQALRGDCSTSDAVRRLHTRQAFGFWDIGPFLWQDVDTPGAHAHAEKLLAHRFRLDS